MYTRTHKGLTRYIQKEDSFKKAKSNLKRTTTQMFLGVKPE